MLLLTALAGFAVQPPQAETPPPAFVPEFALAEEFDPSDPDARNDASDLATVEVEKAEDCAPAARDAQGNCPGRRIVARNAILVPKSDAPWQVSIQQFEFDDYTPEELARKAEWEYRHKCGGTLISTRWVLTAAHCLTDSRIEPTFDLRVRVGASDLANPDGCWFSIGRRIRHPGWTKETKTHDVGLLELKRHPNASCRRALRPIHLANRSITMTSGDVLRVYGWGKTKDGDTGRYSARLLAADVEYWDVPACRRALDPRVTYTNLCAYRPETDSCEGDSGGPIVAKREDDIVQVGIVSWGKGCARPQKPGVYTRISEYLPWIRLHTGLDL